MDQLLQIKSQMELIMKTMEEQLMNDVIEYMSNNIDFEINKIVCCRLMMDLEDLDEIKQKELKTKFYGEAYCTVMLNFCDSLFCHANQKRLADAVGVDLPSDIQLDE